MTKYIPLALIIFRLIIAPIIVSLVYFLKEDARITVIVLMYMGLFSDVFDGIIARKLQIQTQSLRRWDSQADMVFWVSIGISTWMLYPDLIKGNKVAIISIFVMEGLCYLISIIKFGKETCTHAYLSKLFGITLLIAFTSLIGFNYAGIPFLVAIIFGLVSHVDRILITLILPIWTHDIPSCYHAYLIRKGIAFKRHELFN
jgi:phosphatidylglycerophosphate synthase